MAQLSLFIPINKIDEEQRLVYGTVAAEVKDNSGEVFDYDSSKPYFEKWSDNAYETSGGKSYGNLRVMHTAKVAGIVNQPLLFKDDDKIIEACAKVVDDDEWQKVVTGCYTGFSMGGRYVERVKKGSETRYTADPVEISLVDKPCIPTATFDYVKADGLVEQRHFDDSVIQKTDTGEGNMYVPTNDEVLPVAKTLAKAAGKDEADWLDFMDAARDQLIAEKSAAPDDLAKADAEHTDEDCKVENCAKCADMSKGDNPFADKGKDGDDDGDEGKDGKGSDDDGDEDAKKAKKADGDEEVEKSDAPELEQGWRAKDGTFFVKKADAVAHNENLAKGAAAPSVVDQLRSLNKAAEAIANGEDPANVTILVKGDFAFVGEQLAKLQDFAGNELVKGMYEVQTLARILSSLDALHCSVTCEAGWEGDNSTLPAQVLEHLKGLGDTLVAMAQEEVQELVANAGKLQGERMAGQEATYSFDDGIMELSATTLGLEKSALIASASERLEKRAPALAMTKIEDTPETLAKLAAAEERAETALAKAARVEGELAEVGELVKSLQTQFDAIKRLPMPKAPTTGAPQAVTKGDDVRGAAPAAPAANAKDELSKYTPAELADAAIRLSQQNGVRVGM